MQFLKLRPSGVAFGHADKRWVRADMQNFPCHQLPAQNSLCSDSFECGKRFFRLIYDNRNSEKFNQKRAFGLYPSVLDESESRRAFGTHDIHVIQPCDSFDVAISVFKSAVTSFPLFDLKVCEGSSFQGIGFFDFRAPQKTHSRENVLLTFGILL